MTSSFNLTSYFHFKNSLYYFFSCVTSRWRRGGKCFLAPVSFWVNNLIINYRNKVTLVAGCQGFDGEKEDDPSWDPLLQESCGYVLGVWCVQKK